MSAPVAGQPTQPKRKPPKRGARGGRVDGNTRGARFTDDELARLQARADAAGLSLAGYIRAACLGDTGIRSVPKTPIDRAAAERVLVTSARIGGNLYQLVRASNFGDVVLTAEAAPVLDDLRKMLDDLRVMLGRKPLHTDVGK
jgi:hypothetical protein